MNNIFDTQIHSAPSLPGRDGGGSIRHLIILGDGMADWHVPSLGGKTLLQYADTPAMDWLACHGRCGRLKTVPDGFHPGSEVANSSILGYDQHVVYEGRGPLEAAAIGVELAPDDLALRCNFVCIEGETLKNHSCGRLETEEAAPLIDYLNDSLASDPRYEGRVRFYTGVQYRHLLVVHGGNKHLRCTPPHDIPGQPWRQHQIEAETPEAEETAALLRDLVVRSQILLPQHFINKERAREGRDMASSIWPWGGGYRPQMVPLTERFPAIRRGAVITAVDLIRGIGHYAGLRIINVPGATGLFDTDYEAKADAAIEALRSGDDFVYLHVEASDEAGHDGSVPLKLRTIEDLDHRLIQRILDVLPSLPPVAIALLPDHPTPCEHRTHTAEPIPFAIFAPGLTPDGVQTFDEDAAVAGSCGLLEGDAFIKLFMCQSSLSPDPSPVREGRKSRAGEDGKEASNFYRTASSDIYPILKDDARVNRKESTLAEDILWQELRRKQLGVLFRRQHPIGDYIADFVCLSIKLIIEVDGEYHNTPTQANEDQQRSDWLQNKGYRVLRFTNEEVVYDTANVIKHIKLKISHPK